MKKPDKPQPHPYYPRSPYDRWWNDTEPAYSVAPWEGCCDQDDGCACVTEDDIAKWNAGYSAGAMLSGIDWDNISSYSAIAASADLWNDDYDTVCANSANWNTVSGLSGLYNNLSASANWESTYTTVSSNSAYWNSAVNYSGDIAANASAIAALNSAFARQIKIYFDTNTISGDGTINSPYTVKNYNEFIQILNKVYSGYKELYQPDGTQNWMSLSATTDSDGINPYLKTLFNAVNKKDNDQDITLNNHSDLIQWILKHLNGQGGSELKWQEITNTAKSAISSYKAKNTMYYYARPVN